MGRRIQKLCKGAMGTGPLAYRTFVLSLEYANASACSSVASYRRELQPSRIVFVRSAIMWPAP